MKKQSSLVLISALLSAPFAVHSATIFQLNAGVKGSTIETQGQFGESNAAQVSNPSEDASYVEFYLALEHPFLFVPNLKLVTSGAEFEGQEILTQTYSLNGQLYPVASQLSTSVDFSFHDVIAYYEIFDSSLYELDLGLNMRYQDVVYAVSEMVNQTSSSRQLENWQPMAYGKLSFSVPLMGVGAYTEINYLDSDSYDVEVAANYEFISSPLLAASVSLGYKEVVAEWDDVDGVVAEHSWDGLFLGVDLKF